MAGLSKEDTAFLEYVELWIHQRGEIIDAIYEFGKGWEVWAQCDLAFFLLNNISGCQIEREETVYVGKPWRVDLGLWDTTMDHGHIVEMKCESLTVTAKKFLKEANADANKITELLQNRKRVTSWVLALSGPDSTVKMSSDWHKREVGGNHGLAFWFRRFSGDM